MISTSNCGSFSSSTCIIVASLSSLFLVPLCCSILAIRLPISICSDELLKIFIVVYPTHPLIPLSSDHLPPRILANTPSTCKQSIQLILLFCYPQISFLHAYLQTLHQPANNPCGILIRRPLLLSACYKPSSVPAFPLFELKYFYTAANLHTQQNKNTFDLFLEFHLFIIFLAFR